MALQWMLMLLTIGVLHLNLEVDAITDHFIEVSCTAGDVKFVDQLNETWCLQCKEGEFMYQMYYMQGYAGFKCDSNPNITTEYKTTETPKTGDDEETFMCDDGYVLIGFMYGDYADLTTKGIEPPKAMRCAKLDGLTYTSSDCTETGYGEAGGFNGYQCEGTNSYLSGFTAKKEPSHTVFPKMFCCNAHEESGSDSGTDSGSEGSVVPADVVKIPMATCLEVDPFYTDCGASCWSGQLTSNYVIQAVKVNGSTVNEVHCQKQENVTLSLIQVNKFVLTLYPFLVCPTNYLVTALWSKSTVDHTLTTLKCNLLYPHQQMTHCELFDNVGDLAMCDTANGYYMGGVMLDDNIGITQVMCCHVIEFELQF